MKKVFAVTAGIMLICMGVVAPGFTAKTDESRGLDNVQVSVSSTEQQARAHYLLGEKAYKAGDLKTAISEWEHVIKLKPASEYTKRMLAKAKSDQQSSVGKSKDTQPTSVLGVTDARPVSRTSKPSGLARIEITDSLPVPTSSATGNTSASHSASLSLDSASHAVATEGDSVGVTGRIKDYAVKAVRLKVDNKVVDQKTGNGDYALQWTIDNAFIGSHQLQVVAVRGTGDEQVKQAWVEVTEKRPLIITSPRSGDELVDATPVQVSVSKGFETAAVGVYANGKPIPKLQGSGLVWNVPAMSPGRYAVEVRATSDDGAVLVSPPITVRVPNRITLDNPPKSCRITVTDDATMINFRALVHPKISPSKVQFLCDGEPVAECVLPSLSIMWDASRLKGQHSLTARLTDTKGHTYESPPDSVVVENVPVNRKLKEESAKSAAKAAEEVAKERDYGSLAIEVTKVIAGEPGIVGPWNVFLTLKNYGDHAIRAGNVLRLSFDDYTELKLLHAKNTQSDECADGDIVLPAETMIQVRFTETIISTGSRPGARPIYITYCGGRFPLPAP